MTLFFYIFSSLMILGGMMVNLSRNPVHSVLWLIFTFCNASGLMILLGAEFLAMILIIIYVGAVAVLFLFVVMMLNIRETPIIQTKFSTIFGFLLFINFIVVILSGTRAININATPSSSDIYSIAEFLYIDFVLPFQITGLILFVAMIASIALVLKIEKNSKRQDVKKQLARNKENSIEFAKSFELNTLKYDDK